MADETRTTETAAEIEAPEAVAETPAEATAPAAVDAAGGGRGRLQAKAGTVVAAKMDKTVVVAVEKTILHPLYRRYVKRTTKFYAHDEANECREGDRVEIISTRPLSRLKRWRVGRIVARAEGS